MRCTRLLMFAALALTLGASADPARAAEKTKTVQVGDRTTNLTFKDIRFLPRSLDDFPNKKAFVLVFTNTSCPLVQRYLPLLKDLEKEYRAKGVQFLAVNVGAEDSIRAVASQAVRYEAEFPFVKDMDGSCADAVGARATPTVVILDAKRTVRYRGRIDDQYRLGGTRATPSRQDLREALEAVLAGKEVAVKETPVDGCAITRPEPRTPKTNITFADHVAPIMAKHCQECHRPDTSAPFSLVSYEQVASKANALAEVVSEGRMPPWYASDEYGQFTNCRLLSDADRDTLLDWVHTGKAKGDLSKLPPPHPEVGKTDKWLIGKPDLVLSAPQHELPASGDIPYKYVMLSSYALPYIFANDTWMKGIQILPDNPRAVHHCNMAYIMLGDKYKKANFITGTVPGGSPMVLDNHVGFCLPKGASLVLQIHYVTTGKPEKCKISVGFKFADGLVQKQLKHKLLEDNRFAIPPGAPAYPVSNVQTLDCDAIGVGLFVHMHLRGRDMTFRAHLPDGKTETLLVVPNYSFDWQIPYVWARDQKRFPKGTRLEAVAHYDNSTFNPFNPDAQSTVKEGPQTYHEMMNGFVFYTDANERLDLRINPKTGRVADKK